MPAPVPAHSSRKPALAGHPILALRNLPRERLTGLDLAQNATFLACRELAAQPGLAASLGERDDFHGHHRRRRYGHLSGRQALSVDAVLHSAAGPPVVLLALSPDDESGDDAHSLCLHLRPDPVARCPDR